MKSIKSEIKHLLGMDRNSIDALRSRGVRIGKTALLIQIISTTDMDFLFQWEIMLPLLLMR